MRTFKQQCIALRKQDYSLNEIAHITGRPKTSIYAHIRSVPLSEKKKQHARRKAGERFAMVARARKGKSLRPFTRFHSWTPQHALLVAHLLFDGDLMSTKCIYNNRSMALVHRVQTLMRLVYEFEPKQHVDTESGVHRISYHNVALSRYLKEKSQELISRVHMLPSEVQREFLRAFFDDEGCMDFRPKRRIRQIRGYQKNGEVLATVQLLLSFFGISSATKSPNEVVISGKKNLLIFQKEINFSPGVRVNGRRANSTWKKDIEKRELLTQAIGSFKI